MTDLENAISLLKMHDYWSAAEAVEALAAESARLKIELERLTGGEFVVIPVSRQHAEAMALAASHYLKSNPEAKP
jgi:hypothetical protein